MRKFIVSITILCCITGFTQTPLPDGWPLFARTKFNPKLIKELNEYFLVPQFTEKLKSLVGSEIMLKGYYIPFDRPKNQLIISQSSYASCFFCGGSGPESVAEVVLTSNRPKLKPDQVITVKGKLKLNGDDINHMNFILEGAEIIPNEK